MSALLLTPQRRIERAGWMAIGSIYQLGNARCDGCENNVTSIEHRPYGDGHASEVNSYCNLGERCGDRPTDCPAYMELLKERAAEKAMGEHGSGCGDGEWRVE